MPLTAGSSYWPHPAILILIPKLWGMHFFYLTPWWFCWGRHPDKDTRLSQFFIKGHFLNIIFLLLLQRRVVFLCLKIVLPQCFLTGTVYILNVLRTSFTMASSFCTFPLFVMSSSLFRDPHRFCFMPHAFSVHIMKNKSVYYMHVVFVRSIMKTMGKLK